MSRNEPFDIRKIPGFQKTNFKIHKTIDEIFRDLDRLDQLVDKQQFLKLRYDHKNEIKYDKETRLERQKDIDRREKIYWNNLKKSPIDKIFRQSDTLSLTSRKYLNRKIDENVRRKFQNKFASTKWSFFYRQNLLRSDKEKTYDEYIKAHLPEKILLHNYIHSLKSSNSCENLTSSDRVKDKDKDKDKSIICPTDEEFLKFSPEFKNEQERLRFFIKRNNSFIGRQDPTYTPEEKEKYFLNLYICSNHRNNETKRITKKEKEKIDKIKQKNSFDRNFKKFDGHINKCEDEFVREILEQG